MGDILKRDGALIGSLVRNAKQVKHDRAESIAEDAMIRFKRTIEDLEVDIRRLERQREARLDMSPNNTFSIISAKEFDPIGFVDDELAIGIKIRESKIKLKIAKDRFQYLFGDEVEVTEIDEVESSDIKDV